MTSYRVAFLSPEPVTMYLSSVEMSQHNTDEDSFDCKTEIDTILLCVCACEY